MKHYAVLIGSEVNFIRHEEADTLKEINRIEAKERKAGYRTEVLDTTKATTTDGQTYYAVIDTDGSQTDWRNAKALEA